MDLDLALKRIVVQNLPDTLKAIYKNVLLYLREYYLTKSGDSEEIMNEVLDFFTMPYAEIIKKIVNSFTDGLESLGLSPIITSKEFYIHFKEIIQDPDLKTRNDWIEKRFAPYVQAIFMDEIFKFLAGSPDSIIPRLIKLDLIPERGLDDLLAFKENYPKIELLYKRFVISDDLLKKVSEIEKLMEFTRLEENLQSLFFLYKIFTHFDWLGKLDTKHLEDFLVENQQEWSNFGYNLNLSNPSPLMCGVYLADKFNIPIDTSLPLGAQKKKLEDLMEDFEEPLLENPFVVDVILKILKILKIELSPRYLQSLKKNQGYDLDSLIDRDMSVFFKFVALLVKFDLLDEIIGPAKKQQMVDLLKKFERDGAYALFFDDDEPSPLATYSAFKIAKMFDALSLVDLNAMLDFFLKNYEESIKYVDLNIPQTLADVWYALKFFTELESLPGKAFLNFILDYTGLPNLEFTPEIEELIPEKPPLEKDQTELVQGIADALKNIQVKPASSAPPTTNVEPVGPITPVAILKREPEKVTPVTPQEVRKPAVAIPKFAEVPAQKVAVDPSGAINAGVDIEVSETIKESKISTGVVEETPKPQKLIIPPKVSKPAPKPVTYDTKVFVNLWKDLPRLNIKRIERLNLNLKSAFIPHPFTWTKPKIIMHYIYNIKMLGLPLPVDVAQVLEMLRPFTKKIGPGYGDAVAFGEEAAEGPDPENTFYGVAVFSALEELYKLDRMAIKRYLLEELKVTHVFHFNKALYAALALLILTEDATPVIANPEIITSFLRVGPENIDLSAPIEEIFAIVSFLHIVGADRNVDVFKDLLLKETEARVDFHGSIDRLVTISAKAFLALFQLGALEEDSTRVLAENILHYFERHVAYFSEDLADQAKGVSWQEMDIVYEMELEMLFWTLLCLTTLYPAPKDQSTLPVCSNCGQIFDIKPKFCNKCGTPLV